MVIFDKSMLSWSAVLSFLVHIVREAGMGPSKEKLKSLLLDLCDIKLCYFTSLLYVQIPEFGYFACMYNNVYD